MSISDPRIFARPQKHKVGDTNYILHRVRGQSVFFDSALTEVNMQIEFDWNLSVYSHLFNKRGGWNKHGGGAKVAKSLNVELGINEEGGIFGKN